MSYPPTSNTEVMVAPHLSRRAGRASGLRCRSGVFWTRLGPRLTTLNNTRNRVRADILHVFFFLHLSVFVGCRVSGSSTCQRGEIMWNNMIVKLILLKHKCTDVTESWLKVKPPNLNGFDTMYWSDSRRFFWASVAILNKMTRQSMGVSKNKAPKWMVYNGNPH